ncbi:MAG: type II toxin-antitoxin system RelE/ParE family toxin [Calditrichaceae bacterium]
MKWSIEYFNSDVENKILGLPDGLLARYIRLTDLMLEFGPNLGLPHTKLIKSDLFELRVKSKEGIARVFYCTLVGNKIFMLHSFIKKSQKIPQKELKIAFSRLKEVKRHETR